MAEPLASPADFVLEGGGVRGIALVGALAAFEAAGYSPNRVAGTSSGALVGALYAAGVPISRLHQLLVQTRFQDLLDPTPWQRLPVPVVSSLLSELFERGLYRGEVLRQVVATTLAEQGVRTFGDLRLEDPGADPGLPDDRRYRVVLLTTDVTRDRGVRLPWDYRAVYGLDPGTQAVALGVHMSTAIPAFFVPVPLRSALTGETSLMVDGGLSDAFPVTIFDRTDGQPPRWPTFNIALRARVPADRRVGEIHGPFDFLRRTVIASLDHRNTALVEDPQQLGRTVFIDASGVGPGDFNIDPATADSLYRRGKLTAERFLGDFSMERYRRLAAIQRAPLSLLRKDPGAASAETGSLSDRRPESGPGSG